MASIKLSGLASGLETDEWITSMTATQQNKVDNKKGEIQKLEWKQEIYDSLNKSVYDFYSNKVYDMRFESTFNKTQTTTSNSSTIQIASGTNVPAGNHNIVVKQMATNAMVATSNVKTTNGSEVSKSTKLSELSSSIDGNILCANGVDIKLSGDMTIGELEKSLKNVLGEDTVTFDTDVKAFIIGTAKTGADQKISILYKDASGNMIDQPALQKALGITATASTANYGEMADAIVKAAAGSGNAFYSAIEEAKYSQMADSLYHALQNNNTKLVEALQIAAAKSDKLSSDDAVALGSVLNKDATMQQIQEALEKISLSTDTYEELMSEAAAQTKDGFFDDLAKTVKGLDSSKLDKIKSSIDKIDIKSQLEACSTEDEKKALQEKLDGIKETFKKTDATEEELKKALLDLSDISPSTFDTVTIQASMYNSPEGVAYRQGIELVSQSVTTKAGLDNLTRLKEQMEAGESSTEISKTLMGISPEVLSSVLDAASHKGIDVTEMTSKLESTAVTGTNAIVTYNGGITIESAENNMKVNGMSFTVIGVSEQNANGEYVATKITSTQDTESVKTFIKEFVESYNKLIDELNTKVNAKSASDYKPLTDKQKEEMSEKEIERWEEKIKSSLLRKDDTITTLISTMRNVLSSVVELENGKKMGLFSVGINTGEWNEKGKLYIDEDALNEALTTDLEGVTSLFNTLGDNLYSAMSSLSKSSDISSSNHFFNDKSLKEQKTAAEDELTALKKRLEIAKHKAQKKITSMEKLISSLNTQSGYIANMFANY